MKAITTAERRTRLARRHHLAHESPARGAVALADDLVGLHATDPATVFLSTWSRIPGLAVEDVETALYEDGSLVKHLAMRRTMFVLPEALLPVVQAACTDAIVRRERSRLIRMVVDGGVAEDGERWLATAEAAAERALEEAGSLSGQQLSRSVPELQGKVAFGQGKRWAGEIGMAGRVLMLMEAEGRLRRGRPNGGWTSSQHRWAHAPAAIRRVDEAEARAELVRRWLTTFGPGTIDDLAWWTGLGVGKVRGALSAVGAEEVSLEGTTGLVLADDLDPVEPVEPWAALLPALDPTTMGWKHRDWYLGGHREQLFDRNGNAGPTVWWDGRVVGGWVQRRDGSIVVELVEDVGAEGRAAVEIIAGRLEAWLDGVVVTPRFPTPLTSRLRA